VIGGEHIVYKKKENNQHPKNIQGGQLLLAETIGTMGRETERRKACKMLRGKKNQLWENGPGGHWPHRGEKGGEVVRPEGETVKKGYLHVDSLT